MMKAKLAAFTIPAALLVMAHVDVDSRHQTASESSMAFEAYLLPDPPGKTEAEASLIRETHPDFERIAGWISAVGAAVALFDYDGDGLSNDICHVDPRFDTVTILPAPNQSGRFAQKAVPIESGGAIAPMGCLPGYLDGDGQVDLIVTYWGRPPTLHTAATDYAPKPLLPGAEIWHTNASITTDADGDGHLDLLFGNYFPGNFNVLGSGGDAHMQHSMSRARNAGRNRLFLGDGTGAFVDASDALDAAVPDGWTLALGAADLDGDGLPEIYIANDFGPDQLLHNRSTQGQPVFAAVEGRRRLTDSRSRVLGRDSFKGMGVDFMDIDADGRLDIYVSNIAERYALMESHLLFRQTAQEGAWTSGRAPFVEESSRYALARSAWSWDARFADFDNDGDLEFVQATGFVAGQVDRWPELHELAMGNDELLANPDVWPEIRLGDALSGDVQDVLYDQTGGAAYARVHLPVLAETSISRGIATGDIDGDGDVDMVIARQWQPSILLVNTAVPVPSLTLDLRLPEGKGTSRTRPAIGAIATLVGPDGQLHSEVLPGGEGHSGKDAPEIHFGLGAAAGPATVNLAWRDGTGHHRKTVTLEPGRHRILLTDGSVPGAPSRSETNQ
ncbi:CRTAC1 family protein [Roseibium sp. AS2]|uniref:CRTAC1 family protein n=1 Tax=Roseibium sp. AS2 TaxID=3135781 RepID=UPI003176564C